MSTNVRKINPIDLLPDVAVGIMLHMTGDDGSLFKLSYTTQDQAISNLKKSLFEQITPSLLNKIDRSVQNAIEYWLPYIILQDIELEGFYGTTNGMEDQGIYLRLLVKITEDGANIPITIFYTPSIIQVIE